MNPILKKAFDNKLTDEEKSSLATDIDLSLQYVKDILKSRFHQLEYMLENFLIIFPTDEDAIIRYLNVLQEIYQDDFKEKICDSAFLSYNYASEILKGPFPAGEEAISNDAIYSRLYSRFVLKGRFYAAEQFHSNIMDDDYILRFGTHDRLFELEKNFYNNSGDISIYYLLQYKHYHLVLKNYISNMTISALELYQKKHHSQRNFSFELATNNTALMKCLYVCKIAKMRIFNFEPYFIKTSLITKYVKDIFGMKIDVYDNRYLHS